MLFVAVVVVVVLVAGGIEMLLRRRDCRLAATDFRKELRAFLEEVRTEQK